MGRGSRQSSVVRTNSGSVSKLRGTKDEGWKEELRSGLGSYVGSRFLRGEVWVTRACVYHPEKLADFFCEVKDGPSSSRVIGEKSPRRRGAGLCAGCSVRLSARGAKLTELRPGENGPRGRKERLDEFIGQLDEAMRTNLVARASVEAQLNTGRRTVEELRASSAAFFAAFQVVLAECRASVETELNRRQARLEEAASKLTEIAQRNVDGVSFIQTDVTSNYHEILDRIEDEPFDKILSGLSARNREYLAFPKTLEASPPIELAPPDLQASLLPNLPSSLNELLRKFGLDSKEPDRSTLPKGKPKLSRAPSAQPLAPSITFGQPKESAEIADLPSIVTDSNLSEQPRASSPDANQPQDGADELHFRLVLHNDEFE